jgi:undecaprenyl-diphosphatase
MEKIEVDIISYLQNNIKNKEIIKILNFVSNILNPSFITSKKHYIIILILIIIFYYITNSKPIISLEHLLLLLILIICIFTIKSIIKRSRPFNKYKNIKKLETLPIDKYSFPSGHSALALMLAYIFNIKYLMPIRILFPIIVGISRMYLGVHYISDVIGGYILSMLLIYVLD